MGRIADTQAVVSECAVFVPVGCNINVAIVEVIVGEIPVPKQDHQQEDSHRVECLHSRLVKANSVGKDLEGWLGGSHTARHTELGTDVVGAGRCSVTRERGLSEIPALLGLVLGEGGGIEIGLGNGDIEDTGASGDCDWDGGIDACFGNC